MAVPQLVAASIYDAFLGREQTFPQRVLWLLRAGHCGIRQHHSKTADPASACRHHVRPAAAKPTAMKCSPRLVSAKGLVIWSRAHLDHAASTAGQVVEVHGLDGVHHKGSGPELLHVPQDVLPQAQAALSAQPRRVQTSASVHSNTVKGQSMRRSCWERKQLCTSGWRST